MQRDMQHPRLPQPAQLSAAPQADAELLGMRLLLVDDEPVNLALVKGLLQDAGYSHVHSTKDSRNVAKLVRDLKPDFILLDLMMPRMDGYEVLHQLRAGLPA